MKRARETKVVVRRFRPSDRNACRALWKELTEYHRHIYEDPSIGGRNPEGFFDKHLKKIGPRRIWVAVVGDRIVGFAGLIVEGEEAELEPIIVTEEHRGSGVGSTLIKTVMKEVESLDVKSLNVRPVARNASAIAYFHECGFDKVGHIQLFIDYSDKKWKDGLRIHRTEFQY